MKEYSTAQAARHLRVSVRTVAKWVDSGRLAARIEEGTRNRFVSHDSLVAFCRTYGMDEPRHECRSCGIECDSASEFCGPACQSDDREEGR